MALDDRSRRLIDAHRRLAVRVRTVGEARDGRVGTAMVSAEDEALRTLYDDRMAVALDRLSPELRAVLQATVLDGFSTREAALLLGLPEGTVKTRAMRARRAMREASRNGGRRGDGQWSASVRPSPLAPCDSGSLLPDRLHWWRVSSTSPDSSTVSGATAWGFGPFTPACCTGRCPCDLGECRIPNVCGEPAHRAPVHRIRRVACWSSVAERCRGGA